MASRRSYWKLYHLAREFGLTDRLARKFPRAFMDVLGRAVFGTDWTKHPRLRTRALALLLTPPKVVVPPKVDDIVRPPKPPREEEEEEPETGEWEVTVHYEAEGQVVDITTRMLGPDRPTSNETVRSLFFAVAFGHGVPRDWQMATVDWRRKGRRARVSEGSGDVTDLENFGKMIRSHAARVRVERVDV